jgi:hypothetical protein
MWAGHPEDDMQLILLLYSGTRTCALEAEMSATYMHSRPVVDKPGLSL